MPTPPSALSQATQFAIETTAGTALAASKKFRSVGLMPARMAEVTSFRPRNAKYTTASILNRQHSEWSIDGMASYPELVYLLSLFITPAFSTPAGATNARQALFTENAEAETARKTATVEHGNASRARRAAYVTGRDFSLGFSRTGEGIPVGGTLIGRAVEDPFTLTSSGITTLAQVMVAPSAVDIYADDLWANLGTTKLLSATGLDFNLGGIVNPFFPANSALTSFDSVVEGAPDATVALRLAGDSVGEGIVKLYETGATKAVRVEAKGAEIDAGVATSRYRLTVDVALQVTDPGTWDDEDNVWIVSPTFSIVSDPVSGIPWRVAIVSTIAAL